MEEKELVTIAEAVRLTGLSRQTIMRRIKERQIPARRKPGLKKGAPVLIPLASVLALLPPEAR